MALNALAPPVLGVHLFFYEELLVVAVGCITGLIMPLLGREARARPAD